MLRKHLAQVCMLLWVSMIPLVGCSAIQPRQGPVFFYLAGEIDKPENQKLVELIIYAVEDVSFPGSGDWLRTDYMVDSRVINVFSSPPDRRALWDLVEDIPKYQNSDESIASALYSLIEVAKQNPDIPVQAVLVTDGTANEQTIESLSSASLELANYENVSIYVVGVDPEVRTDFARGFAPIPSQVTFSSSVEELSTKFRSFGG